jgi:predicted nucleotidyltransferase
MATQEKLKLDLPPRYLAMVEAILRAHAPNAEVWAYGSRVTGQAYPASDLDLVVRNPANLEQETSGLSRLRAAFTESNVPIRVEVHDWARLPDSFRREIEVRHSLLQVS